MELKRNCESRKRHKPEDWRSFCIWLHLQPSMTYSNSLTECRFRKTKTIGGESLEKDLHPDPLFNESWTKQLKRAGEFTELLMEFLFSTMNVKQPVKLSEIAADSDSLQQALQSAFVDLSVKGQEEQAKAVSTAIGEVNKLTDPDASMTKWMKLVIFWAPYLDAHAVRGRYPTGQELKKYVRKKDGVQNLVAKSKEIMEQSKAVLKSLAF